MKIKEQKVCAAFAWSPSSCKETLIAAGSIAGAMDDDFSSEFLLTIYDVDLKDFSATTMKTVAEVKMPDRVHRIDWGSAGGDRGVIAGALVDGSVILWDADLLIKHKDWQPSSEASPDESGDGEGERHPAVLCVIAADSDFSCRTLHFNPLAPKFLATGGSDKTLRIWDIANKNESGAMEPKKVKSCEKSMPLQADIIDIRWNTKFQHILATTTATGQVHIWDLKGQRVACTFQVAQNQSVPATALAWHPEEPMLLAVARDDPLPAIQVWDLKKAMAPIKEFTAQNGGHMNGVLALSWSSDDVAQIVSCGRDGRTIFWNERNGTVTGELPRQDNWVFGVRWAPHVPSVLCTGSFDRRLTVFGTQDVNTGRMNEGDKAPKYLLRPCPVTFGYGGRIALPSAAGAGGASRKIRILPVTEAIKRNNGDNGEPQEDLSGVVSKHQAFVGALSANPPSSEGRAGFLAQLDLPAVATEEAANAQGNKLPMLTSLGADPTAAEEAATAQLNQEAEGGLIKQLNDAEFTDLVSKCVVVGKLSAAVSIALQAQRYADAFAIAQLSGQEDVQRVHRAYVSRHTGSALRFAPYLGAVAQRKFVELAAEPSVPWEEVLALYACYVDAREFAGTCKALGHVLKDRGNLAAAATVFTFAGDVDETAAVWAAQKAYATHQELVHRVLVLEQSQNRRCTHRAFGEALAQYANQLAAAGDFATAMAHASRAAEIGIDNAALVADRVQFQVPQAQRATNVRFPWGQMRPLPNASSPECQMMESMQPHLQQQQQQPQPAAQRTAPAAAVTQPSTQQRVDPNANVNNTGHPQPNHHHQQHHHHHHHNTQTTGPAPRPGNPAPATTSPNTAMPPPNIAANVAPLGTPTTNTAAAPVQNNNQPPPPQNRGSMPAPSHVAPPPAQNTANNQQQPPAVPTQNGGQPNTTTSNTGAPPRAEAAPAANFDVSVIPAPHQPIVTALIEHTRRVADKRKRDAIEKALTDLFGKMAAKSLSEPVLVVLAEFVSVLGTPKAKDVWRKLTENHWSEVQSFNNVKFVA